MTLRVAIDCGGTRARAGLYTEAGGCVATAEAGGANPVDYGPAYATSVIVSLVRELTSEPAEVVAAVAGVRTDDFAERIARDVAVRLNGPTVHITDDLAPLLYENLAGRSGVLAISGTGSCVMALSENGEVVRAGGRGPLFGDAGSAYQVAVAALRAAADAIDGVGPDTALVQRLPAAAGLDAFEEFRHWARSAPKAKIAALAPFVARLADEDDAVALACLDAQADALAAQVFATSVRAQLDPPEQILFHGGLIENAVRFRDAFIQRVAEHWPEVPVRTAEVAGHEAVARYALRHPNGNAFVVGSPDSAGREPATEQRLSGPPLDALSPAELVRVMAQEDARAAEAGAQAEPDVAALIDQAVPLFRAGGRLIYVGAGTSGRLGVLDASECHPTFGVPPDRVIGIMAGGDVALRTSVEGAEDETEPAMDQLRKLQPALSGHDVVVGITASGTTPYVRAAVDFAREQGAVTAIITCNLLPESVADHVICLDTGPEVLSGSTRLKAGTATKMVLNQISTGILALCGYVYEGYMIGVTPTNAKLRDRARRILSEILGIDREQAGTLLDQAGNQVPVALLMYRRRIDCATAQKALNEAGGSLRDALNLP